MPALDTTRDKLTLFIVCAALATLAVVAGDLALGGRPDPPVPRAAATLLDGNWRFRTGDDASWANAVTNDSDWETIDLTAKAGSHDGDVGLPDYVAGWMAHGHPDYVGHAWYRRVVDVPRDPASWDILGPTLVDHAYELFWNGRKLGGSGRLGAEPRVAGTRPMLFQLPDDAAGSRGVLAIRVYMLVEAKPSAEGGGLHAAPFLAPRPVGEALHDAQWQRTIAGYVVDAIEPLAMFLLGALAIGIRSRSSHQPFLAYAAVALALMAARRLNNAIVAWTDLQDLRTYSWLASVMWVPTIAAWAMAWNRWSARPWRSLDAAALLLMIIALVGVLGHFQSVANASRYGSIALFTLIGVRVIRHGPMRALALVSLVSIVAGLFGGELLDPLGVPGIWFPFGIGVSRTQYIYALAIPLIGILIARTLQTREG